MTTHNKELTGAALRRVRARYELVNSPAKKPWPQVRFIFDGATYWWSGWFGCQLASMEWRTLPAGTTRDLNFGDGSYPVTMRVFSTRREGLRVLTTWAVNSACCHDEHQRRILDLKARLAKLV